MVTRRGTSRRKRRHAHTGLLVGVGLLSAALAVPALPQDMPATQRMSLVLAYLGVAAILVTLTLGPLHVLRGRPNPVSSDLRRDVGLFAGVTGVGHVVFSLQHHFGGSMGRYFFTGGSLRRDQFGGGSWTGLVATVVLLGLVAISNDRALRRLGRKWKALQRGNYALVVLALLHSAIFWRVERRAVAVVTMTVVTFALVLALQAAGLRRRLNLAAEAPGGP